MNQHKLKKGLLADQNQFVEASVVEIPVLLKSSLLPILEAAARDQDQTVGALIRGLIRDFLNCSQSNSSAACDTADVPPPRDAIV